MAKMNVVMASANEVLTQFHGKDEYCHGFDKDEVLLWLRNKNERWHDFGTNIASWQKMNVGMVSVQGQMLAQLRCKKLLMRLCGKDS